jgi:hypothetical protein
VDEWPDLLYPQKMERREPVIKDRLDSFEELIHWYRAQSVLHVQYFREPYVTQLEEYGRITFDRRLSYQILHGSNTLPYNNGEMIYFDDPLTSKHHESPVILEIKVERFVPFWAIDIVQKFCLVQRGFSKYCYGIDNSKGYLPNIRRSVYHVGYGAF